MNQPPHSRQPPDWRRPRGVAVGTWKYVNERSIADHYDAFVADTPLCDLDRRLIDQYLPRPESGHPTVLDLGCGTGRLAIPLAEKGFRVLGIDLSRAMLERLVAKSRHDLSSCKSTPEPAGAVAGIEANLVELDCLASDAADHAVCMFSTLGMIQGRANRIGLLRHVRRAVKPDGKLVLHVHRRWAALREPGGVGKLAASWWKSLSDREHEFGDATYAYRGLDKMFMHRFSIREIRQTLQQSGWTVEQTDLVRLDGRELTQSVWDAGGAFVVAGR